MLCRLPCSIQLINIVPNLSPFITGFVEVRPFATKLTAVCLSSVCDSLAFALPGKSKSIFHRHATVQQTGRIYLPSSAPVPLWSPLWARREGLVCRGAGGVGGKLFSCVNVTYAAYEEIRQTARLCIWKLIGWKHKIWLSVLNTKRRNVCLRECLRVHRPFMNKDLLGVQQLLFTCSVVRSVCGAR